MRLAEILDKLESAQSYVEEAKSEAYNAWDKADDAARSANDEESHSYIYDQADEARDYAENARAKADRAYDVLEEIVGALEEIQESGLLIEEAGSHSVAAATSADPLALLRGSESGNVAVGVLLALATLAGAVVFGAPTGPTSRTALLILAVLLAAAAGKFLGTSRARISRRREISGYHARADQSAPFLAADLLARGLADIVEVGGMLYLFTATGWREITGLTLGREHSFTLAESDAEAIAARPDWIARPAAEDIAEAEAEARDPIATAAGTVGASYVRSSIAPPIARPLARY